MLILIIDYFGSTYIYATDGRYFAQALLVFSPPSKGLHPKARNAISTIFKRFQNMDEYMYVEDIKSWIIHSGVGESSASYSRVICICREYGTLDPHPR